jgi:putative membrane protein
MISGYSDHAANERTFLAWVRTGIAAIALGLLIEKLNLFMAAIASHGLDQHPTHSQLERLSGMIGRYDGVAFILGGVGLTVLATARFIRTTRLLDDPATHSAKSVRAELVLSAWLVLMVGSYSVYLAFSR